jgi:hypothetical protein
MRVKEIPVAATENRRDLPEIERLTLPFERVFPGLRPLDDIEIPAVLFGRSYLYVFSSVCQVLGSYLGGVCAGPQRTPAWKHFHRRSFFRPYVFSVTPP